VNLGDDKLLNYITIGTRDAGMDFGRELSCSWAYSIRLHWTGSLIRNSVAGSAVNNADRVRAGREAHA
jgi:hypothetical protein